MDPWQCCRLCLSVDNLSPIFLIQDYHEKYTEVLYEVTGVKITNSDTLPQHICTSCITITNESYKFRKRTQSTQKILLDQTQKPFLSEAKYLKSENIPSIDISDLIVKYDDSYSVYSEKNDNTTDEANLGIQPQSPINIQIESTDQISTQTIENGVAIDIDNELQDGEDVKKRRQSKRKSKKENEDKKEKVKEQIECEYCHKILTSKLSLRNHYKIHTGFDVVCEHCGKKFITRRLLLMHCKAKHGYEKTDKCTYCDYRASNAEQVKIHERLHTGERPYVCAECGASFHRRSSHLQHVATHLPARTVKCEQCPAVFQSSTLMRIHLARHRAPQYVYSCRVCEHTFARRRNVARHLQRIHSLRPGEGDIRRTRRV